jgi:hypothetical protein
MQFALEVAVLECSFLKYSQWILGVNKELYKRNWKCLIMYMYLKWLKVLNPWSFASFFPKLPQHGVHAEIGKLKQI